uniref:Uracil-DNA glycosylase n=1 Tax=Arcella intermedia TaxID=1963864 RepID=A0A6B2LDE6_9EUKA
MIMKKKTESKAKTAPKAKDTEKQPDTKTSKKRKIEEKEEEVEDQPKKKIVKKEVVPYNYEDGLEAGWKNLLSSEFENEYYKEIKEFVATERQSSVVYPADEEVFSAFQYTPLDQVKIVIIGQDPYFNPNQAHGLSFSVKKGTAVPPSLNRIYNVLEKTIPGFKKPKHGYLESWARQGVLMINATLTVRKGKANSHANCGWQNFTKAVLGQLSENKSGLIFFLWGTFAQKLGKIIDKSKHHILEAAHPSPMSGDKWNSCNHFAQANDLLKEMGKEPIDWTIQ